jgi:SAM-dependent methyltransferase
VIIVEGDFNNTPYEKETFAKVCSVNTLYFWTEPLQTARKVFEILMPGGELFLAFEDIEQLRHRNLSRDIFRFYSEEDVLDLLTNTGFSFHTKVESRKKGDSMYHCAVAVKK